MGNSEVGHLTIGSGGVLDQDLQRVNRAIEDGSFFENPALKAAFAEGGDVHLLGLVSHGGVHSHIDHVKALLRFRPSAPGSTRSPTAATSRRTRPSTTSPSCRPTGSPPSPAATTRWTATGAGSGPSAPTTRSSTARGSTRTTRWPRSRRATSGHHRRVRRAHGDRRAAAPRARRRGDLLQLPPRPRPPADAEAARRGFDLTTITRYRDDLDCPVAFGQQEVTETLAEVLAENDVRQLHVAETEKYAHVTYFFNGGREQEWPGETRILVPSPREVGTYDQKPEMSAGGHRPFLRGLEDDGYGFAVVNFANPDMVGHSGVIPAVVKAVETADACLGRVVETVRASAA